MKIKGLRYLNICVVLLLFLTSCTWKTEKQISDDGIQLEAFEKFASLEDFEQAVLTPSVPDSANLSSLVLFYMPDGLPEEYKLYKITADPSEISFWYLPEEAASSDSSIKAAEENQEYFKFVSRRRDAPEPKGLGSIAEELGGSKKDLVNGKYFVPKDPSNLIVWEEDGRDVLMLYVPKEYVINDWETLFYTNRYLRNEDNTFQCYINHPVAFQSEASTRIMSDEPELILVEDSVSSTEVTFLLQNSSDAQYMYGCDYQFEVLEDGVWYTTDYGTKDVPALGLIINPGTAEEQTFYAYGESEFEPNTYRVILKLFQINDREEYEDGIFISGEFTVE